MLEKTAEWLNTFFGIFFYSYTNRYESRQGIFTGCCIASYKIGNLEVLQLFDRKPADHEIPLQATGQVARKANIALQMYKPEEYQVRPELRNNIEKKSCGNG